MPFLIVLPVIFFKVINMVNGGKYMFYSVVRYFFISCFFLSATHSQYSSIMPFCFLNKHFLFCFQNISYFFYFIISQFSFLNKYAIFVKYFFLFQASFLYITYFSLQFYSAIFLLGFFYFNLIYCEIYIY